MNKSRINRRTFIASIVLGIIFANIIIFLSEITGVKNNNTAQNVFGCLIIVIAIYLLITWIVATVNRLHDIGWPWWLVIVFGLLTPGMIVMAIAPGEKTSNKYGEVPDDGIALRNAFIWW